MEIGQRFDKLTLKEYFFYIDNYRKYTDFNTLGLYRSILENDKLKPEEKIEVREYAHKTFKKSFEFLQLKDPQTFFEVNTIGEVLTNADEQKIWDDIKKNQQKILADKRIKHRNFGTYSKHNCGDETCPMNGLMTRQGSLISTYGNDQKMHFKSDNTNWYAAKIKSDRQKVERKAEKQIIQSNIATD